MTSLLTSLLQLALLVGTGASLLWAKVCYDQREWHWPWQQPARGMGRCSVCKNPRLFRREGGKIVARYCPYHPDFEETVT